MSPLADTIRPKKLADVVGQSHLLSPDALFYKAVMSGHIPNMIFYGPSGTGKTTVAEIIADMSGKTMRKINATNATLADIKEVTGDTASLFGSDGILLYLDEIQYFNKKQQQSLLEFIEDGRITLIGSTTDNPYFSVYPAILSRCSVFEFRPLTAENIVTALNRAYRILARNESTDIPQNVRDVINDIANTSSGDARKAIGAFELCYHAMGSDMTRDAARHGLTSYALHMDKDGDNHYDLLSAFQKSIRGSDENAAVFYLAKLLEAGDILSPIRRLLVIASEDIGLACPTAITVVKACCDAARELGLPEARLPLAEAVIYLATLPKSNSAYMAYAAAAKDISDGKGLHIPDYIRDSTQPSADRNRDYIYPHDYPRHYYRQTYLPKDIENRVYYHYGDNKTEGAAKTYWDAVKGEKK